MNVPTYQPSGRFEATTIPFALGAGLLVALGLGWVYQWLVDFIPLIYINALLTLGFGGAIGLAVGFGASFGKCRNAMLAIVLAVVCATAAEAGTMYFAYKNFQAKLDKRLAKRFGKRYSPTLRKRFVDRYTLSKYIKLRVKTGWRIKRTKMTGVMVWIIWGIEFAILLILSVMVSRGMTLRPFCERRKEWAEEVELPLLPGVDADYVMDAVNHNDLESLIDIGRVPLIEDSNANLKYELYLCEGVGYVTINLNTIGLNDKGEEESNDNELVEYATLAPDQVERLQMGLG